MDMFLTMFHWLKWQCSLDVLSFPDRTQGLCLAVCRLATSPEWLAGWKFTTNCHSICLAFSEHYTYIYMYISPRLWPLNGANDDKLINWLYFLLVVFNFQTKSFEHKPTARHDRWIRLTWLVSTGDQQGRDSPLDWANLLVLWENIKITLWLCQNSYWTWPNRNSWFTQL